MTVRGHPEQEVREGVPGSRHGQRVGCKLGTEDRVERYDAPGGCIRTLLDRAHVTDIHAKSDFLVSAQVVHGFMDLVQVVNVSQQAVALAEISDARQDNTWGAVRIRSAGNADLILDASLLLAGEKEQPPRPSDPHFVHYAGADGGCPLQHGQLRV